MKVSERFFGRLLANAVGLSTQKKSLGRKPGHRQFHGSDEVILTVDF